jgi:hypothetical protein
MDDVLDKTYIPILSSDFYVFKEKKTFMYAVLKDHLNTNKVKSLVNQFTSTLDAQGICCELKKHALSLIEVQLLGDM